jgi:L-cysteine:1D-myo-inositol 2-amino-2-deoxy-alpha-D-glucopyranoside ligase
VAINLDYLGPHLTLHGGGADLAFPHHETEIAIAESATQVRPFSRLWWHTATTRLDGEKMSKSLGNMVFVRDLVPRYGGDAVRHLLLSTRYREPLDWDEGRAAASAAAIDRLRNAAGLPSDLVDDDAVDAFRTALEADLDTPRALDILESTTGATTRVLAPVLGFALG